MVCKRIVYIVAVTNTEGMAWMNDDLAAAQQVLGDEILEVQIYVTGGDGSEENKGCIGERRRIYTSSGSTELAAHDL